MAGLEQGHGKWAGKTADFFLVVEHFAYMALGLLLCVTALLALAGAGMLLWDGLPDWSSTRTIFLVIDRLLFVLMLIEILHTVRASLRSGTLTCEPFLVVGLIATIRRVLVITLVSSQASRDPQSVVHSSTDLFRESMIELAVLSLLILVMVTSIYMLRRGVQQAVDGAGAREAVARD